MVCSAQAFYGEEFSCWIDWRKWVCRGWSVIPLRCFFYKFISSISSPLIPLSFVLSLCDNPGSVCGFKPTCSISTLYCLFLTLTHVSRSNTDWRSSLMSCAMMCESRRRSWTRPIIQCSCQLKPRAERRDESTVEMPGREVLFSLFFQCTNQPTHKHNWRNGYFSERKETWTSTLMLEDQFSNIRTSNSPSIINSTIEAFSSPTRNLCTQNSTQSFHRTGTTLIRFYKWTS